MYNTAYPCCLVAGGIPITARFLRSWQPDDTVVNANVYPQAILTLMVHVTDRFKVSVSPGLVQSLERSEKTAAAPEGGPGPAQVPADELNRAYTKGFQDAEQKYQKHILRLQQEWIGTLDNKEVRHQDLCCISLPST